MFVSCVCHQFQPHLIQWRAMESTHFSEHRRSSHRWGHHFQLLRTCQNMSKPTKKDVRIDDSHPKQLKDTQCIFLTARNASVPNPILNRRKFKVHAMYIILECPMSILRSISATLHFCPEKERFTFACAISSFYENNTATYWFIVYCMKVLYIYIYIYTQIITVCNYHILIL